MTQPPLPNAYRSSCENSPSGPLRDYAPDEPDDPEALFVAAHLWASRLAFYLIQSAAGQDDRLFNYGEDAGLYVRHLEELIVKLKISMSRRGSPREFPEVYAMSVWSIESLAERVGAELAEQRGDYQEALARLANSLTVAAPMREINEAWEHSENPEELVDLAQTCPWRILSRAVDSGLWYSWSLPWLSEDALPTQQAAHWFEALKAQPNKHDWSKLAETFNDLANEGLEDVEVDGWLWDYYWFRAGSWAENQLTADELRKRNEATEDERAAKRLRAYFFDEAQWDALSEDAKAALISADRAWMDSGHKVLLVLDQLQVATEDVLYHYLWNPLLRWRDAGPRQGTGELDKTRKKLAPYSKPVLSRYVKVLEADGGAANYLRKRFATKSDAQFVKGVAREHFEKLLDARNKARHSTKSPSLSELRDLYAQFMGLGRDRLAILPELVRILTQPPSK